VTHFASPRNTHPSSPHLSNGVGKMTIGRKLGIGDSMVSQINLTLSVSVRNDDKFLWQPK
jgi:hypothetical protein